MNKIKLLNSRKVKSVKIENNKFKIIQNNNKIYRIIIIQSNTILIVVFKIQTVIIVRKSQSLYQFNSNNQKQYHQILYNTTVYKKMIKKIKQIYNSFYKVNKQ